MSEAVSVRLDDQAQRALRSLEATGLSRSEAIRSALVAAADRLHHRRALAAEADRIEMAATAELMESLRAPW